MRTAVSTALAAVLLVAMQAGLAAQPARLVQLAQADVARDARVDAVTLAEMEVEAARARLRDAMAGKGELTVREARQLLRQALARLEEAREADEPTDGEATAAGQPGDRDGAATEDTAAGDTTSGDVAADRAVGAPEAEPAAPATPAAIAQPEGATVEIRQAEDGRVIVREGGQLRVQSDDSERLQQGGAQRQVERNADGTTTTTVLRPNGTEVVTLRDPSGEIVRRVRRGPDGEEQVLIGNGQPAASDALVANFGRLLPRLQITIPQSDYVVDSEQATEQDLQRALVAPPVEQVERAYSLREIRRSGRLRSKLRRIDVNTITFDTGSAGIGPDQVVRLDEIGSALNSVLWNNPDEVFLIEGHTDAVGTNLSNLALSDRRAESVAYVLSAYYGIPSENLVTQGYGEEYLKIPTAGPERRNRRVTLRRITPLLRGFQ